MGVRQTSREAYRKIEDTLGYRQRQVYEALFAKGPMTNAELGEHLGWRINTVTPRTNELVKMALVREAERRYCKVTGNKAIAWEVPGRAQPDLFDLSV